MKNKLLKIINHYGIENQLKKLNEENFELIEAITHFRYVEIYKGTHAYKYHYKHIKEEIADNLVLLTQFILYYNINLDDIEKIFKYKVDRQLKRIESEKYNG